MLHWDPQIALSHENSLHPAPVELLCCQKGIWFSFPFCPLPPFCDYIQVWILRAA